MAEPRSLFEDSSVPQPPHTYRRDDRPWVWVLHGDGRWYEGILWGWTWDPGKGFYWGYVDFHAGSKHHMHSIPQDRIRRHEVGHP